MAHECPECGQMCYCGGDIDDCLLNCEEDVLACTHCPCEGFTRCRWCGCDFQENADCTCPRCGKENPPYEEDDEY